MFSTVSKKDIAGAFILLCTELIPSCLVIISPTNNAMVEDYFDIIGKGEGLM